MDKYRQSLLSLLSWAIALGGCSASSSDHDLAERYLQRLEYEGHETKDGDAQQRIGNMIVALGENAVPVLFDRIATFNFEGRHSPGNFTILRRIGPPGKDFCESILSKARSGSESPSRRYAALFIMILSYDSWEYVDEWFDATDSSDIDIDKGRTLIMIEQVRFHLESKFGMAPVPIVGRRNGNGVVLGEFRAWWKTVSQDP